MKYLLTENWCLRGWAWDFWVLFNKAFKKPAISLPREDFMFLNDCDGKTEIEASSFTRKWEKFGAIRPAGEGEELSPAQNYRYFPWPRKYTVQMAITARCNMNCLHCFASMSPESDQYTYEECDEIISQLEDIGVAELALTGGEPLVHPDFLKIADRIAAGPVHLIEVLTNGMLLTDEIIRHLAGINPRMRIGVSFDGLGTHDWMRNHKGAEEIAIDAMKRVQKAGLTLRATVNVNPKTIPRLLETCRMLNEIGAEEVFLIATAISPRWLDSGEALVRNRDYLDSTLQVAETALREKWPMAIHVFNAFYIKEGKSARKLDPIPVEFHGQEACRCYKLNNGFFIGADRRILPCDGFQATNLEAIDPEKEFRVGKKTIDEILSEDLYGGIIDPTIESFAAKNSSCSKCEYLLNCCGGCRANAYGRGMGRNPITCEYFKGGFAKRLKALIEEYRTPGVEEETLEKD